MKLIALMLISFILEVLPSLCANAEFPRYPDRTIMTRYRSAFQGAAAAGRRLAASLRIRESGEPSLRASEDFTTELEGLLKVIDELYSGYKSAGIRLEAAEAQLKRSDAQLAGLESAQGKRLAVCKDAEKAKRLKSFKTRVGKFRRSIAAQRLLLQKQRAGLSRTMRIMQIRREEIAGLGAGRNMNKEPRQSFGGARASTPVVTTQNKLSKGNGALTKDGSPFPRSAENNTPAAVKVRVARGQTALGIALANKISLSQLMRLNPALKNNPSRLLANTSVRVK